MSHSKPARLPWLIQLPANQEDLQESRNRPKRAPAAGKNAHKALLRLVKYRTDQDACFQRGKTRLQGERGQKGPFPSVEAGKRRLQGKKQNILMQHGGDLLRLEEKDAPLLLTRIFVRWSFWDAMSWAVGSCCGLVAAFFASLSLFARFAATSLVGKRFAVRLELSR